MESAQNRQKSLFCIYFEFYAYPNHCQVDYVKFLCKTSATKIKLIILLHNNSKKLDLFILLSIIFKV